MNKCEAIWDIICGKAVMFGMDITGKFDVRNKNVSFYNNVLPRDFTICGKPCNEFEVFKHFGKEK